MANDQQSVEQASPLTPNERLCRQAFYLGCVALAAWMLWRAAHPSYAFQDERIDKDFGLWSLRFLFLCLIASPVSRMMRLPLVRRWRRPLGLAAFGFALVHTVHFLTWGRIWPNRMMQLWNKPYLLIGTIALVLFLPMALTSFDRAVRWMNPRRWRVLHLLVYPTAALSVIHEVMAYAPMKGEAGLYSALALILIGWKLVRLIADIRPRPRRTAEVSPAAA